VNVKRTYTPQTVVSPTLIPRPPTVGRVVYTVVCLATLECTRGVINLLYHCRRSARDRQCEHDSGI